MAEYIEREAVFDVLFGQYCASCDETEQALNTAIEEVKAIPAADVVPVRHGRWVELEGGDSKCSLCGCYHHTWEAHGYYCQHCGAKMDGEQDG